MYKMSAENNGGKTGYYDLPLPDREEIIKILLKSCNDIIREGFFNDIADQILTICPQTLNDLIEHKDMAPWQHEVMKACYAINERALKNGGSFEREVNKIIYWLHHID